MEWLDDLNQEQRLAVEATEGPLLIVAGPGTGKTKTLTSRIAFLIASGQAKANEILALTFTNKAAKEMQQRVGTLLPPNDVPLITTFHALCYRLLGDNDEKKFIGDYERSALIGQLRKDARLKNITRRELSLRISQAKNLPPSQQASDPALERLVKAYNHVLEKRGLRDFDDLLLEAHHQLHETKARLPYRYILVDEFQDTNALQYELLFGGRSTDNLCVIGDPLQSIYGFRGVGGDIFARFLKDFSDGRTITLTTNYRSVPEVTTLANALYPDSPALMPWTNQNGQAQAVEVLNEYSEAAWVVARIEQALGGSDFLRSHQLGHDTTSTARTFKDFAILYRTHHAGKTLKRTLSEIGIPFQVVGEGSPYEKPAVRSALQILCYLTDPTAEREGALGMLEGLRELTNVQRRALLASIQRAPVKKPSRLITVIGEALGLDTEDITWLAGRLVRFDATNLHECVRFIDSLNETDFYDPRADMVTLSTIHAAKGLEFTHVFLIATEEDMLPLRAPTGVINLEEEKRLFYVAVTRARESLDILYAKTRTARPVHASRFIQDLPRSILPIIQDSALIADERRLKKRRAKRSQSSLFDLP